MARGMVAARQIVGKKFGRLTVLEILDERHPRNHIMALCRCDCGSDAKVIWTQLRSSNTRSCGCLQLDAMKNRRNPCSRRTHPAEFRVWSAMRTRCTNPRQKHYQRYGGRGIAVCERWNSFENFLADMGPKPSAEHSIDRIDNDGNYCPENCRWATGSEQARNKRGNTVLTHDGKTLCAVEWAEITGISAWNIRNRIHLGWTAERALTTPLHPLKSRKRKTHKQQN